MKSQSNEFPEAVVSTGKKHIIRYNIVEASRLNEAGESETYYEFDSVKVAKLTKEAIVEAIIRTAYSQNDEFKMSRISKVSNEWKAYDAFAEAAVAVANDILAGL
jgi:hypothetical protein